MIDLNRHNIFLFFFCSDIFIVSPLKHAVVKMELSAHSIVPLDDEVSGLRFKVVRYVH